MMFIYGGDQLQDTLKYKRLEGTKRESVCSQSGQNGEKIKIVKKLKAYKIQKTTETIHLKIYIVYKNRDHRF